MEIFLQRNVGDAAVEVEQLDSFDVEFGEEPAMRFGPRRHGRVAREQEMPRARNLVALRQLIY